MGSGNEFFIDYFIPEIETDFLPCILLFRANFVLVESIIWIKLKPFFKE